MTDNPAAGRTEARMRPDDVPGDLVVAAHNAWDKKPVQYWGVEGGVDGLDDVLRHILAAVIPAIRAAIADDIERIIGIDPPIDDQDQDIRNVVRHLRGLCTICGEAPDAEPCGHAHAINLRGDQ